MAEKEEKIEVEGAVVEHGPRVGRRRPVDRGYHGEAGVAVVLFSEELEELFTLSDRMIVLYEGRIMGDFPIAEADLDTIGLLMGGQLRDRGDEAA